MHFYENKLYILGGIETDRISHVSSTSIYKINLDEFDRTLVRNSKKL